MDDKKISEAVELLYKGAKMLSQHCPECKVPLFEDKGRIFCPSCKREVVFEKDVKSGKLNKIEDLGNSTQVRENTGDDLHKLKLESVLKDAIASLVLKLKNSEDLKDLREIVDLIDKLTNLIEKLKRLKYI